jgi:hypothetical protein
MKLLFCLRPLGQRSSRNRQHDPKGRRKPPSYFIFVPPFDVPALRPHRQPSTTGPRTGLNYPHLLVGTLGANSDGKPRHHLDLLSLVPFHLHFTKFRFRGKVKHRRDRLSTRAIPSKLKAASARSFLVQSFHREVRGQGPKGRDTFDEHGRA